MYSDESFLSDDVIMFLLDWRNEMKSQSVWTNVSYFNTDL